VLQCENGQPPLPDLPPSPAIIAVNKLLNKTLVCVLLRYNISELHHFIEIVYINLFKFTVSANLAHCRLCWRLISLQPLADLVALCWFD
jgi:hypothetical protein